jgi:hypothetical protein
LLEAFLGAKEPFGLERFLFGKEEKMSPVVRTVKFAAIIVAVLCLIWCATMVSIIVVYRADGVIAVFMANVMTPAVIYSMIRAPRQ